MKWAVEKDESLNLITATATGPMDHGDVSDFTDAIFTEGMWTPGSAILVDLSGADFTETYVNEVRRYVPI